MVGLLRLAEWLCGEAQRRSIFEPLVADWQRELTEAQQRGRASALACRLSGGAAFARSLMRCSMSANDWLPTSRAAQIAALAFFFAICGSAAVLLMVAMQSGRVVDPGSMQTQALLLYSAAVIVPPAMLPALFLMRRDPRSTARQAAATIAIGATLTGGIVLLTTPSAINRYFSTFNATEREYQRNLANDRAGRHQYPGTAVRERRGATTVEQRRDSYERFMRENAARESASPARPLRARDFQPLVFAVLFGVMGWTLAGLGAPSFARAIMWWVAILVTMLALTMSRELFPGVTVDRSPRWVMLPFFAALTAALVAASWRRHPIPTE